jgi:pilus assembly protein CpaE
MMSNPHEKLTVLSSGGDSMLEDNIALENFEALLDHIMIAHPVVVVDLSGASNLLKHIVLARAHETILVTTPTLPAVRASRTLIQEIKEIRGGNTGNLDLVLNQQGFAGKSELTKVQIEEGLERKLSAVLPFVPEALVHQEAEGKKLSDTREGAAISAELLPILRRLLNLTTEDDVKAAESKKGGLGGLFRKTKAK